jgi:hypothetical protein
VTPDDRNAAAKAHGYDAPGPVSVCGLCSTQHRGELDALREEVARLREERDADIRRRASADVERIARLLCNQHDYIRWDQSNEAIRDGFRADAAEVIAALRPDAATTGGGQ